MGIQIKSLIAHLRARQEDHGVKAFHFHHVLRDNLLEPAAYPSQAQLVLDSGPDFEDSLLPAIKSESKPVKVAPIPTNCPAEDIIMEIADMAPGDGKHKTNCKKVELEIGLDSNDPGIWSPVNIGGIVGDPIPQATETTDTNANLFSDGRSSQHIPPTQYHPPPHVPNQGAAPPLQQIPTLPWPRIPAITPVPPDSHIPMSTIHPAYQQFLAFLAAQQAHEQMTQPGPYQPPAPFIPVMPFAPPNPPHPVTPFGPSHHQQHSMDPAFGIIDPHLIPPGEPPFSSSINPHYLNQPGAHIMNPIPAISINPPTVTPVKRTPKRKRIEENDSPVKTPTRSGRKRQPTRKLLESQGG